MQKLGKLVLVLLVAFSVASCGKDGKKFVDNVKLKTFGENDQKHARIMFEMNLGDNVTLPSLDLPVRDWRKPGGEVIGKLRITDNTLGGTPNGVEVTVNLTQAFDIGGGEADLPNGKPLPIHQIELIDVVEIPINKYKAEVYIAASNGKILIAYAAVLSALDPLGDSIDGKDIFVPFKFGKVSGTAGVFSSVEDGKTGLYAHAIFDANFAGQKGLEALAYQGNGVELKTVNKKLKYKTKKKLYKFYKRFKRATKGRQFELEVAPRN